MSDVALGPGWWQASDGRWYPPEALAQALAQAPPGEPSGAAPGPFPSSPGAAELPGLAPLPGFGADQSAFGGEPGAVGPSAGMPSPAGVPAWTAMEGYGHVPTPDMVAYPWPVTFPPPVRRRSRAIGALLVLLGLAGVVWGIGELFNALALNASPVYPHDEQVGAWIATAGILLASVVTVAIGLVVASD